MPRRGKDQPIRPDLKLEKARDRTIEQYSDLAEYIREHASFKGAQRGYRFGTGDQQVIALAAIKHLDDLPPKQARTIAGWVYWDLFDQR